MAAGKTNSGAGLLQNQGMIKWAVIGAGVLLLILLTTADKTQLENQKDSLSEKQAISEIPLSSQNLFLAKLPALAADADLDKNLNALKENKTEEGLKEVVQKLEGRGRLAYAAYFAEELAKLSHTSQDLEQAGVLYQKAMKLSYVAKDSTLYGECMQKATTLLEEAIQKDGSQAKTHYHLALAYIEGGGPPMKGIMALRKAIELKPDYEEAIMSMGMFSIQSTQYEKAEQRFERVLELDKDNMSAAYYLAYARVQQNKQKEVKVLLERVLQESKDPELKEAAKKLLTN